jgi:hypothetical protein
MSVLKVGAIQPNSGTKVNITGSTLLVTTASGHFSGSYEGDGSRLEGVAGFPFTGSGQISGSLLVTGSSTLAFRVSGSSAFTGSLFVSGTLSGSFSGSGASLTGIVSSSTAVLAQTASVATRANGLAPTVTASFADISTLARAGSGSFSGSYQGDGSLLTGVVASGSIQSASVAVRANTLSPAATASFADKADEAVTSIVIPVTVVDDGGNKYAFNGVTAPKLSLKRGSRYRFDLSDSTNGSHPFGFRLPDDTSYTVGVTTVGSAGSAGAYVDFDVNFATSSSLKYYCTSHGNAMGNKIELIDLFDGVFSGSFSGSYEGDGSNLTGIGAFPFTGSAAVSGTLLVTGSSTLALRVTGSTALTGSLFVSGAVSASAGFSGSFQGDGSDLTGVGGFPHTGSADITGSLLVTGSAFVTSLTETSALRYKKYVKDLNSETDNIYQLRPVHFRWRDDNRKDYGLIAEEVEKIYPDLVTKGDNGDALGISYTKLTALLVKTIQELTDRVEKLENK